MTEIELLNAKLFAASADLVDTRALTNRIRTDTQKDIDHVISCLDVILTEPHHAAKFTPVAIDLLRIMRRHLDKLPRN